MRPRYPVSRHRSAKKAKMSVITHHKTADHNAHPEPDPRGQSIGTPDCVDKRGSDVAQFPQVCCGQGLRHLTSPHTRENCATLYAVTCSRKIDLRDHHVPSPCQAAFDKHHHHGDETCTLPPSLTTHRCDGGLWVSTVHVLIWSGLNLPSLENLFTLACRMLFSLSALGASLFGSSWTCTSARGSASGVPPTRCSEFGSRSGFAHACTCALATLPALRVLFPS